MPIHAVERAKPSQTPEPFRVLGPDGDLLEPDRAPPVPVEDLVRLYRGMRTVRLLDERLLRLQRQGRLGFYMAATGEEATHHGAAYPLRSEDWIFPCYREIGAAFWRGYGLREFLSQLFGNADDPCRGRQMPVHHAVRRINYVSISSPIGTQVPQAVGMALAARAAGAPDLALVYFGDGATSSGGFHTGMNLAGVTRAPVIFFCRNNGWAISVPLARQTAAPTLAAKAAAYGMPGVRVDGNDLLAVIAVVAEAAARARAGEGPTFVEAVTYRRGAHSSSDDPSVYREATEPERWARLDPVARVRRHLERKGAWSEDEEQRLVDDLGAELGAALRQVEAVPAPPRRTLFEDVYHEMPWHLAEQAGADPEGA